MPCFVAIHGRSTPFWTGTEEKGIEGTIGEVGGGDGRRGGSENCNRDVKWMNKLN